MWLRFAQPREEFILVPSGMPPCTVLHGTEQTPQLTVEVLRWQVTKPLLYQRDTRSSPIPPPGATSAVYRHSTAQRSHPLAAVAWFKARPRLNGLNSGSAQIRGQGYVAVPGNYLLYPAIQASPDGAVAIVFTLSGATHFRSAADTVFNDDRHSFGHVKIAAPDTGPYSPQSTRWGDYSWATLDPSGASFWLATEYIPPLASQTSDGLQNWGTRVLQVSADD
jgi:hypothetical protein